MGTSRSHDAAPTITAQPPSPPSSSMRSGVGSLPAQNPYDGASTSPGRRPSLSSSDGRDMEGWWSASGFHDDPSTSRARTPSPSSSNWHGGVGSWATWQPHDNAPTSTRPPSLPPPNRRGSAGSWASWQPRNSPPSSPSLPPSPSSLNMHGSTESPVVQRLDESATSPPAQPPSPSPSSSSSSSSSAEYGFVLAARLEPFAPPMQASTSLLTPITAESEPAQNTSTVSLPVVVVQRRDGSASWSRLNSSRASSPTSLVPAVPSAPRSSPPVTPPPERSRSPSPPNLGRPPWSPTSLPTVARQGLGLYIPRQSHSGSLSLSTPGTRFHTPVDESAEPRVGTQAYPSNPAPPASAPASIHTSAPVPASTTAIAPIPPSRWTDGQEHHAARILPSAEGPLLRASEPGGDVAVGNGDTGREGGVEFGSAVETNTRSRNASGGSNDGGGESVSRSADELQQDSGTTSVQIDKPPPSPHVSRNSDTDIVALNQRPLHVIQNFDTDTSAGAHSPKRGPDMDTPSLSSTGSM
ncbi:hypothetical protein EDB89DRAFT_829741 [Lactarius sanguifluus]|nr:hypothetical protein EDB89DRAFT_829741 [Lactarius sanguifluus]